MGTLLIHYYNASGFLVQNTYQGITWMAAATLITAASAAGTIFRMEWRNIS
jgi:hypothetical protein